MATQYEIEHGIKPKAPSSSSRRIDMSTFHSFLDQISTTANPTASSTLSTGPHNNPHATPTPVDVARLLRLVQEQMETLATTSPDPANREFLTRLVASLEEDILDPRRQQGLLPLCRKDFSKKKEVVVPDSEDEDEDPMGMFS
ncbi:unnamed protein product [Parascedosporium putredinis]|uniref:Uncharacterized protein n=1 Tax=Parascedosporium putredinis TaxID=1442378 RepID=A0A9P1MGJ5_9PEZI|nr:unnamed protein product [Parascedosporium putredinis]CAI8004612.1 unnamed protein product [Parascedosporium putredinis]